MFKSGAPKAAGAPKLSDVGDSTLPLASGWLRTKGRDNSALVAAVAGNRLQQMKSWNLWWTVLSHGVPPAAPFLLRCYADQALAQLKARGFRFSLFAAQGLCFRAPRGAKANARRALTRPHPRARRRRSRWPPAWRLRCWTPKSRC